MLVSVFKVNVVHLFSGHFPWLKQALVYLYSAHVKSDLKYLVDVTLAIIEERRHQKTEFKVLMDLSYAIICYCRHVT